MIDFILICCALVGGIAIGVTSTTDIQAVTIQLAYKQCEPNQGFAMINAGRLGNTLRVTCVNGATFNITNKEKEK